LVGTRDIRTSTVPEHNKGRKLEDAWEVTECEVEHFVVGVVDGIG